MRKCGRAKPGRHVLRQENITILDDAYNANPQSMRAAIEVLDGYTGDYKVAAP